MFTYDIWLNNLISHIYLQSHLICKGTLFENQLFEFTCDIIFIWTLHMNLGDSQDVTEPLSPEELFFQIT